MKEVILVEQPKLGSKILELRKKLNMTQEILAESANVSSRTIQRIEQGEVVPRLSTLRLISYALDFDFNGEPNSLRIEKTMLFFIQLSNMLLFIIFPILVLIWNNSMSKTLEIESKRAINFQISLLIIMILGLVSVAMGFINLIFISIGVGILVFVILIVTIFSIRNMIALANNKKAKYIFDFKYMRY